MNLKSRIILAIVFIIILSVSVPHIVRAYGRNFVFPAARRSAVSGYTYADPDQPSHLAWDYRFTAHTKVAAAQRGWVARSRWVWPDGHELCDNSIDSRGNFIILNHTSDDRTEGTGLETWYFHLSNTGTQPISGTYFALGDYMAYSGDTGCGQAHLHFATKDDGIPFDPYAGTTEWVGGEPIPMGYRDQNNIIQAPFKISLVNIREKWIELEGSPGPPTGNSGAKSCDILESPTTTMYYQNFERGYIYYCGTSNAVYVPYAYTIVPNVRARLTCGAGDDANSYVIVENNTGVDAQVSITIVKEDGDTRDSRAYNPSMPPGARWEINTHDIVFDWLIGSEIEGSPTPGIFEGTAYVYSDPLVYVAIDYTDDLNCAYIPSVLSPYPTP